jgi:hypothetical protein
MIRFQAPIMPSQTDMFVASEWLSCGRVFDQSKLPPSVQHEITRLLRIPTPMQPTIPSRTLPVAQLLDISLCASLDCDLSPDTIIFSTNPPLLSLPNDFTTWSIPPLHCVTQLLDQFSQAWFNGHTSIIHPLSPTFHLPFWVLSYWRDMSCALEARLAWISAHDWVLQRLEDEEDTGHGASESVVVDEVLDSLECLPWDVDLKGFGAQTNLRTPELLPLLADTMVNGRVLDALIAAINDRVDEHNDTAVETLDFSNILFLGDTRWSKYHFDKAFTRLHYLGDSLHDGTIQRVIFPVNIANVHWAIVSVDASTQMILYGDSLGWSMPSSYVDAIRRWLKNHGFAPFDKGSLSHGEQTDSFSCAIAALNTIKHAVFNHHPLFTNDSKYCLRMEEFLMLTKSHFEVRFYCVFTTQKTHFLVTV